MPTKKNVSLEDLFEDELKDIYNAERQVLSSLPKMSKMVDSEELKEALEHHLEQTKTQIERIEKVFEEIGKPARGKKCLAMEGIINEGKEIMEETMDNNTMDAGIIAAAQKVEHYEIASYGTVIAWAKTLGYHKAVELLTETLEEEKNTDRILTKVATTIANERAAQETEE